MSRSWLLVGCVLVSFVHAARAEEPFRQARSQPVDVENIKLELDVDLKARQISGSATIELTPRLAINSLSLDAVAHEVSGVHRIGDDGANQALVHHNTGEEIVIEFAEPLVRGHTQRIRIDYRVRDPKTGMYFFGPSEADRDVPWMAWTQGEPNGNRFWFPSFDHPNERQTTEILATVETGFEVLSNGRLISKHATGDGKTRFHWKQDKPHVAYLVTLVVGEFTIGRQEWRGIPVTYYVDRRRASDMQRTFGRTVEMLDFFSDRFGIEYPWQQYAQVVVEQFIVGGMENTSATTLHRRVMHDERALLDSSPDGLIAHELGHQWWGDLLTCKDWAHLWLNEGFATYCEVLWTEHKLGADERDYLLYAKSRSARSGTALKRAVVDYRYEAPRTMFDSRAYPKGGWVLHMLRNRVGDDDFFRALERYGTAYAYSSVETSDLRRVFERLLGVSLERFFHDWTGRAGHPVLKIGTKYDAQRQLVGVTVEQTQEGEAFQFPLKIELSEADSSAPVVVEQLIDEKEVTFYTPVLTRPTLVRIDPDYTLLAEIEEEKSDDWWQAQLLSAPGAIERIRAVEHYADSKQDAHRELLAKVLAEDSFYGVQIEAAAALGTAGGDVSLDALIAGLENPHPKVRRKCAASLGVFVDDERAIAALAAKHERGDASYFVEAAALEALSKAQKKPGPELFLAALKRDSHAEVIRRAALSGLGACSEPSALDVLLEWTQPGHPRACRMAALGGVGEFLTRNDVAPSQRASSLDALLISVKQGESRIRRAGISALRHLGSIAGQPAIGVLKSLAEHDPDERVRVAAHEAAKQLVADNPASQELERLRGELDRLTTRNSELEDRLLKLEAK